MRAIESEAAGMAGAARRALRAAVLAGLALAAVPADGEDLLILRDGSVRPGRIQACVGDRCVVDGQVVDRDRIAWIGLERDEQEKPPAPRDPQRDEVHLGDGRVVPGELVGVSLGEVVLASGSFPRAEVAWIRFALPEGEEERPGQLGAPPEEPEPEPEKPKKEEREEPEGRDEEAGTEGEEGGTPAPDPRPAPAPPPLPTGPVPHRCLDLLDVDAWHGTFRVDFHHQTGRCAGGHYHVCRGEWHWTARGSFELGRSEVPNMWVGDGEARLDVDLQETFGYPDWVYIAKNQGSGSVRLAGEVFQPRLSLIGCEYAIQLGDMTLPVDERLTRTDSGETQTGRGPAWLLVQVTSIPLPPSGRVLSGSRRMPVEGEQASFADFFSPNQGASTFLFAGLWSHDAPPSGTVSWSICSKGTACPPAPPLEGERDDCPEPRSQRALLDAGLDQQRALLERLAAARSRYQQLFDQAEAYRSDFEQAARDCRLWGAARVLMSFLIGNYGPSHLGRLGDKVEPGKQFANFLSWLEKVLDGDPSWVLPDAEFKEWFSAEDAYDALKAGWDALGDSSPDSLLQKLQECGAPTTDLVYQDAVRYLRLLQEMGPALDEMNRTMNDLRQKDLEIRDLWEKLREACREYEICRGGDPARCDPPPGPPPGP